MPAHVIYEKADSQPAGFSSFWLKTMLRQKLGFDGVIFSDDLTMAAAEVAGSYPERANIALAAGCDMILVCNNSKGAEAVLDGLINYQNKTSEQRLKTLYAQFKTDQPISENPRWKAVQTWLSLYQNSIQIQ
jgi:beta-N-acetylhexosaminidase